MAAVTINLKVLSPSTEVGRDLSFPDIAAATTVKDLRLRIQNEIPSQPAVERMRLIYRGRVILHDADTLVDVFGLDNIRNSKEQTIHLVLRELHPASTSSSPAPPLSSSTISPSNPFRSGQTPPQAPTHTNPFRPPSQPRPNSQPMPHAHTHTQPRHHHPHHVHPQFQAPNPLGPFPFPPQAGNRFQGVPNNMPQDQAQARPQHPSPSAGTPALPSAFPAMPPNLRAALSRTPPNVPTNTTRTIRQEGIGPNGEHWTVTQNTTNLTIPLYAGQQPLLPRAFPRPARFPSPVRLPGSSGDAVDSVLARIRAGLDTARQEMENVRALLQGPGGQPATGAITGLNPPSWRHDQIRHHVQNLTQNLDQVHRGLASIRSDPTLTQNQDVESIQRAANELRGHSEQLNAMLERLRGANSSDRVSRPTSSSGSLPPSAPGANIPHAATHATTQPDTNQPSLATTGPELFLLSSPQGPVGILYDQRGMYTTAPIAPTLPFQSFTQQFASNRNILAGIGQQIAQRPLHLQNQPAPGQPAVNIGGEVPRADQPAPRNPAQNQNQAPENDRMVMVAGHVWLLFKLACFVYIFSGGGGWYRPVMLGLAAAVVYIAQIGILENQFNHIRRHFQALMPHPQDQPRNRNQNHQAQNANGQREGQQQSARNITPEQAAQRLVQQRQEQRMGWIRERTRTVERAFALFVASLWPGVGERMVRAQQERERAEREAEEERRRLEEEERLQHEARAQEAENKGSQTVAGEERAEESGEASSSGSKGKGKEKAEEVSEALAS